MSTCLLCAPKHREKYKILKNNQRKMCNKTILSNTSLKQINRYIFNPGIYDQSQSLHVHCGLAFDMNENGKISVGYLYSAYSICITNLLHYNQQHFIFGICALKPALRFQSVKYDGLKRKAYSLFQPWEMPQCLHTGSC